MQVQMRRATADETREWRAAGELYELFGYLVITGEPERPVEYLGTQFRNGENPRYEVHAPDGMRYCDGCTSHLCHDIPDVLDWGASEIEPRGEEEGNGTEV